MDKVALITGITGQTGSYLAELLLSKSYVVHGLIRRSSTFNTGRIDHLRNNPEFNNRFYTHYGDMTDAVSLNKLISTISPDEVYNLAAQSHVKVSFEIPEYTANSDALGVLRLLEAVRSSGLRKTKIYQASTSELYGKVMETPQNENTGFRPCSPYAVAKLYGYWAAVNYREAYGMFVSNGILFNHESPRRGESFVTKKIVREVSKIKMGISQKMTLGNLDSLRDWGHARDYAEGIWRILQHPVADDFVLATGKQYSVRWFVEKVFSVAGFDIKWVGSGLDEVGVDTNNGEVLVDVDSKYFRPVEVDTLLGDSSKAKMELGWEPITTIDELISEMYEYELDNLLKEV